MNTVAARMQAFDREHAEALRRIWVVGDVHGQRRPLLHALQRWEGPAPAWLVFAGDIDLEPSMGTLDDWLQPLYAAAPGLRVAWIPGNHDSDDVGRWQRLHACGAAVPLHGRVVDLDGVRVAGLGGTFQERIWMPPSEPQIRARAELEPTLWWDARRRQQLTSPTLWSAIFFDEWLELGALAADLLITHEAPSCHPKGFQPIGDLARALGVARVFHGHHHDDRTSEYDLLRERIGFDAVALEVCAIKTGAGELVAPGLQGW